MNIEAIVPELFESSKKIYYCQRCLNHGVFFVRKTHKNDCDYRYCTCEACSMVDRRRELNYKLNQITASDNNSTSSEEPITSLSVPLSNFNSSKNNNSSINTERLPHCQRCAQHGLQSRLKGHKKLCPYRNCDCVKCQVVVERQRLMADQIKLRRRQRKEKVRNQKPAVINKKLSNNNLPSSSPINSGLYPNIINNFSLALLGQNSQEQHDSSSSSPSSIFPSIMVPSNFIITNQFPLLPNTISSNFGPQQKSNHDFFQQLQILSQNL
ncbi:Doublesex-and mab-3-related transcription factor 3 [Strongyloides ratti]|uniref:Doublesex-and mab-3-related transcription factor 3 n=1 Tax=Strongyloides ratti TaxID=34506 RepID=A0A090MWR1_STRRB|nr:Doublesex-and mab-3-related transcription factor 3 [Strongyloides ratti]CEF64124.1 Doublesex-and mab-3-related transcription factor 3 [Strongyloides ratti]